MTDSKLDESDISLSESIRISNNIRMILLGLFALIGFIILVYAIFTASVSAELAQIATSVFIAQTATRSSRNHVEKQNT